MWTKRAILGNLSLFSLTHVASISKKVSEVNTGKLVAVTLITDFQVYITQSKRNRQKTDSTVRESPEPGHVNWGVVQDWGTQTIQRKVVGVDHQGQHGILRALRDLTKKKTMPWLCLKLRSGHCKLHMRQMHAAYRKETTVEQGKIRRLVNPRPRYQKETYPRCQTWSSMRQCMY